MREVSRRKFILSCSSGLALSVLAAVDTAYAQSFTTAFWKVQIKPNVLTTQFIAKAAVLDTSFQLFTTQVVAKAAVLETSFQLCTTQLVVKAAVLDESFSVQTTQYVVKVAVLV